MTRIFLASLPLLALAACGGGDSKGKSTTTLDAVEVQPGSVSDSMIILDNVAGDGSSEGFAGVGVGLVAERDCFTVDESEESAGVQAFL